MDVATATGAVGIIVGIAGAWFGWRGYRTARELKRRDLRLDLRKSEASARQGILNLKILIEEANNSRQAVLAATGLGRSGNLVAWNQAVEKDAASLIVITERVPDQDQFYKAISQDELEGKLVVVHEVIAQVQQLIEKYQSALAADNVQRQQIRADMAR